MINVRTILLVEDNSMDIELTIEALEEYNLANQVIVAKDGVEAMEYLLKKGKFLNRKDGNPAVVLLDIKMPRMDGIEVLEAIRNDENLKYIPVVMLTTSREAPDLKRCYDLGVNAYVVKPVDFNAFVNAVKPLGVFWALINELPDEQGF